MILPDPVTARAGHGTRAAPALTLSVVILAVWQGAAALGCISTTLLPAPVEIAGALVESVRSGELVRDAVASLSRVMTGFLLAAFMGVVLGTALGLLPRLRRQVLPILELLRPVPPIAWIPLAILWFGLGSGSAVFIVCIGGFFPILTGTYHGVANVRVELVQTAKCLGASRALLVSDIVIPPALPHILAALRTGLGMAWMSLIAAELIATQTGLGYTIQLKRLFLRTDGVLAGMLVIGLLGYAMNRGLLALENRLTTWNCRTLGTEEPIGSQLKADPAASP